ncbi:MAG: response regulator transcription factor [Actinomycetota bacterium]|nr:response regulator transcription factor [Actinomycetota bacterium]
MSDPTRCLAVDDHPTVRQGLSLLFDEHDDLDLVSEAESGEEALDAVARHDPEVVIMDVRLPGIDGISAVKRIAQSFPEVKTVIFSAYGDKRLLSDAISAGARGYVMKCSPPEDLVRAVRTVASGRPFVDPSLSPALITTEPTSDAPLSEREREILQLLAAGLHTEKVAERIGLSAETVKSDTKRAIQKLEADTRVHAVAIALRKALIE